MFSKPGYESLSALWDEFERKYLGWCHNRACAHFNTSGFNIYNVFGSPLDPCENLLLNSLETFELALLTPSGEIIRTRSRLPHSEASIFKKATMFESMNIARDPDEAGSENEWLFQMGSCRFTYWPHMDADFAA